MITTVVWIYD